MRQNKSRLQTVDKTELIQRLTPQKAVQNASNGRNVGLTPGGAP